MSCCARCGQGICSTAGKIALNKVWHKNCFCCYSCNRPLHIHSAKIYYGEVFCPCCCPQDPEICPLKICKVNSTPSFNPECSSRAMRPVCCASSDSFVDCRPRDVHSCSCIPGCCRPPRPPCTCRDCCEEPCQKRIHCRPRSPKPLNFPPRPRVMCTCNKCFPKPSPCCPKPPSCCPKPPSCCRKPSPCCRKPSPCCVTAPSCCPRPRSACCSLRNKRQCSECCDSGKKIIYIQSCSPKRTCKCNRGCNERCWKCCDDERCRRCGEKVFAAEKVMTSHGPYHLGCFSCYCCCKALCVKSMFEACGEIYCKQCYNNYFGVSGYRYCCS